MLLATLLWTGGVPAHAQGRRVATLTALAEQPLFFHGAEILIRADAEGEQVLTYLVDDEHRFLALDVPQPPEGTRERFEIIGTFWDIGRLESGDPRIAAYPFERISETLLNKPWPGVGELQVLIATSATLARELGTTTLRTVALEPERHIDQGVTVTGRFRGRNLYGDLPESPRESRWDFVLVSADAAVWVVGMEPKGDGFDLDVLARVDTGHWLEVTGNVRYAAGMVIIEAVSIALAESPDEPDRAPIRRETRQGPPPEVILSVPLEGDTDVPTDTLVRVQFSRDMDPDSFEERIAISYVGGQPVPVPTGFEAEYRPGNRVLQIRFEQELIQFRTLQIELLEGIIATDGAPLTTPWQLSFFIGR